MNAPAFTHIGIYTDNPEAMRQFYERVVGLVVSDTGRGMLFKRRIIFMTGVPHEHHQIVLVVREEGDPPGGAMFQISFQVHSLDELRATVARAVANGARDLNGMNHGNAWSVYFRDPDGNAIEIYMHTGWHTPQPFADRLPLEQSDEEIRRITDERVKALSGTMAEADWTRVVEQRLSQRHDAMHTEPGSK